MSEWERYEPEGDGYIPVEQWGKDHWSTFLYLEVCAVDHKGIIDNRRMRCNPRLHRELSNIAGHWGRIIDGSAYPTILQGGATVDKHDDWSCLEDMVAMEMLVAEFRTKHHGQAFGGNEARIKFTDKGLHVAAVLRHHKAEGGTFSNFIWAEMEPA